MPTSTISGIGSYINYLNEVRPQSVLDIGVGFGRMGFLAREFLETSVHESYQKKGWKSRIEGIEVFPDYIQPHHHEIYDQIHFGNGYDVIDTLGQYDVVILGDVLEHFEKPQAWDMLDKCVRHCNRAVFLFIPLGPDWEQGEAHGNEHERHLSFWELEEFEPFTRQHYCTPFSDRSNYGRLLIYKEDYLHYQAQRKADEMAKRDRKQAIAYLEEELKHLPPNLETECVLIDHMVHQYRIQPAMNRLKSLIGKFPDQAETIRSYLAQLETQLQKS